MSTLTIYFNGMDDLCCGNTPHHKVCDLWATRLLCALCGGETAVDIVHRPETWGPLFG